MRVQLPLRDRASAGALLGEAVAARLRADPGADATADPGSDPGSDPGAAERSHALSPIVLGIPRGGVIVAAAVAGVLDVPLDVLVAHKIGAPGNPEFALGAVTADGTTIIESWARRTTGLTDDAIAALAGPEVERAHERERRIRGDRPRIDLHGRTAILVDDGIATGATVHAAVLAARALGAAWTIVAAPIASEEAVRMLTPGVDALVLLAVPAPFWSVGQWYERFEQVEDEEVRRLLAAAP
jgi:putative phosphoribosyl transferase